MYTVLRVTGTQDKIDEIKTIGTRMNEIVPSFYHGIGKKGVGFSEDISKSELWSDHIGSIASTIEHFKSILLEGKALNLDISFDIAIEMEDIEKQKIGLFLHQESEFLKKVGDSGASIEISFYIGTGT